MLMMWLRRRDISPTMKAASKQVSIQELWLKKRKKGSLTYSQVGAVKSTQADFLIQRNIPERNFIHAGTCGDEDDDGVNKKNQRNLGRIWRRYQSRAICTSLRK